MPLEMRAVEAIGTACSVQHHVCMRPDKADLGCRARILETMTGRMKMQWLLLQMTVRINGVMVGTQSITCHGQIVVQSGGEPKRRVCIKFLEPSLLTSKVKKGQVSICLKSISPKQQPAGLCFVTRLQCRGSSLLPRAD